jgi:hypothetical protein
LYGTSAGEAIYGPADAEPGALYEVEFGHHAWVRVLIVHLRSNEVLCERRVQVQDGSSGSGSAVSVHAIPHGNAARRLQ